MAIDPITPALTADIPSRTFTGSAQTCDSCVFLAPETLHCRRYPPTPDGIGRSLHPYLGLAHPACGEYRNNGVPDPDVFPPTE